MDTQVLELIGSLTVVAVFFVFFAVMLLCYLFNQCYRNSTSSQWRVVFIDNVSDLQQPLGMSDEQIARLQSFKYSAERGIEENEECCSICLFGLEENEDVRLLPQCPHCFHKTCIDPWLRLKRTCPVCNTPVLVEIDTNVYEDENEFVDVVIDDTPTTPPAAQDNQQITITVNLDARGAQ